MFDRLKQKWGVGPFQLVLIIFTFAAGGSLTGYTSKKIMNLLPVEDDWLWVILYILLVTLLWPLAVLLVSIPTGQFRFFSGYIQKIGVKMRLVKEKKGQKAI